MTKYKQMYQQMVEANQAVFDAFKVIHDGYQSDRKQWSARFHEEGKAILEIIREYERRLCSSMERGKFAAYSNRVSDKFREEIRKSFPLVDRIGVRSNLD